MNKFYLALLGLLLSCALYAQEEEPIPEGWQRGAGLGLDLAQLLQINPKQGAGQNRLGFGGAFNGFANLKDGRKQWDNSLLWQFGMQRLGSGVIAQGSDAKIPFQKQIDELRLNSKYGFQVKEDSKWFYTGNASFLSQLLPTYQYTNGVAGNFVADFLDQGISPIARLFAPATVQLALGMDYKPNENFSLFYSPLGAKFIIVASDSIAARGVHGNQVSGEADALGFFPEFENVDAQLGSQILAKYTTTFVDEKGAFTSSLNLFSNYLRNPQNVDVDWANALSYKLFKNFQATLLLNIFYDDDVDVQITDYDFPNGVNGTGKRVSITQQMLLSYAVTF